MIDEAELRQMTPAERQRVAALIAEIDHPGTGDPGQVASLASGGLPAHLTPEQLALADPYKFDPRLRRQRRLAMIVAVCCCVFLVVWIVILYLTLPHHFDAQAWRGVWVRFDVLEVAAFGVTAWAIWRERQVLIILLTITGTMLFCDAYFDVGTAVHTSGVWLSLASAAVAELPLAVMALIGANRLLQATVEAAILAPVPGRPGPAPRLLRSVDGGRPSLRETRLSGQGLDEALAGRRAAGR